MSDGLQKSNKNSIQRAALTGMQGYSSNKNFSTLTPELITKFTELVGQGLPENRTCEMLGLNGSKYGEWMKMGREYFEIYGLEKHYAYYDHIEGLDYSEEAKTGWLGILAEGDRRIDPYLCCILFVEKQRAFAGFTHKLIERSLLPDGFQATWTRDLEVLSRIDRNNWSRDAQKETNQAEIDPDESYL